MEYLEQKTCQQIVVHVWTELSWAGLRLFLARNYLFSNTHTHTHRKREMERGLPQRDCCRLKNKNSDKPETIATDIWHQVGSIFAAYLHSQHTHTHTCLRCGSLGQWQSVGGCILQQQSQLSNGHRELGSRSCESTRYSRKLFVCHVIYKFSPWNAKYLRLPKPLWYGWCCQICW